MVAHFDYYRYKGDNSNIGPRGVILIPRTYCGESKMKDTDDTTGGYQATIVHTTTCPAIANALSTVLGSYLLSIRALVSNGINANIPSMVGANRTGAAINWTWMSTQCILPSDIQIFGFAACSSSYMDIGEANEKLAVFNFINHLEYGRYSTWLRSVSASNSFSDAYYEGVSHPNTASSKTTIRPLIHIS